MKIQRPLLQSATAMRCLLVCCAILAMTVPAFAQLRVSNNPVGAAVVITQPSAVAVTWSVSGTDPQSTVTSEEGLFVLGGETLGRVDTFLTATTGSSGAGAVNETLLIPPDVVNRAYKHGAATFFYRRQFRSATDGATGQSELTCRVATSAYGNFSIAALTLYFENERGEATFEQNDPYAHAFAEVQYNGSGLLKGTWEVQEPNSSQFRVLQQVNYHLTYGDRIVFQSPPVPPLPTVVAGQHNIRFTITQPVSGFPLPTVSYFVKVKSSDADQKPALKLEAPISGSDINRDTAFRWNGTVPSAKLLKFSVHERGSMAGDVAVSPSADSSLESSPLAGSRILQNPNLLPVKGVEVFSAALPPDAALYRPRAEQLQRLRSDVDYVWFVQALDDRGKVVAETELRVFRVQ